MGVGQIELATFVQNLTIEELIKAGQDGRLKPGLAESWKVAQDGLAITVELRPRVRFHDGSPLTAQVVVDTLRRGLPQFVGPLYADVSSIEAISDRTIELKLRRPSTLLLESLESLIPKPGAPSIGTGPFMVSPGNPREIRANADYYLGRPSMGRIVVSEYPSVRSAWAEMLRNHLDMVYEVGVDARDTLESATSVNVFSYTRHYQYMVLLNTLAPPLRAPAVRRALNAAIDRATLVREALNGHGAPSQGPVWPRHWALKSGMGGSFGFDPQHAAASLTDAHVLPSRNGRSRLSFKCLVAANDERIALVIKQQLEAIGVDMVIEEAPIERFQPALAAHDFEGMLVDVISGPNIFRPYVWWHSKGPRNRGTYSSPEVDGALDFIRNATSDNEYRAGVLRFQQAIVDDPPAIFLAWDERARAVSSRIEVRGAEPDTDILGTLRMWRPAVGSNSN